MKIVKKLKLIGKIAFYTVFVVVLLLVIGMFISKISNRVFFVGDKATVWVMTDSMETQIPEQSYVLIQKVDPADIKENNIITFYSDDPSLKGNLNTHRVLEVSEDGKTFVTKGDKNIGPDQYPARADAVVGIYVKNLDTLSFFGRIIQSPIGLLLILILTAVLTFYSFCWDSLKKMLRGAKHNESADKQE